jgi:hypothetical protein
MLTKIYFGLNSPSQGALAVSATTTITAAPTATAAPAITATAAATAAPAAAAITAAAATATEAATAATILLGSGFIDFQRPAADISTVKRLNRGLGLFVRCHLDEGESA